MLNFHHNERIPHVLALIAGSIVVPPISIVAVVVIFITKSQV